MEALTWRSDTLTPTAEIVRAQLAAIGVRLNLRVHEANLAAEKFFEGGEAPLFLTSWGRYPEPDWIASLVYRSDGAYNAGNVADDRLDALVDEGAAEADFAARRAIYRRIDEIVLGEAIMVPMLYGVTYAAAQRRVMGLDSVFGWDAKMNLHRIWLAQG